MIPRVSLSQFLIEAQREGQLDADLRLLLEVLARTAKALAVTISKGVFAGIHGEAERINVQGEMQKRLDVVAHELILQANAWGGHLAAMASEEADQVVPIPERYPRGGYLLLFDPLDGSSNIDVNISVGTIFSVLRNPRLDGSVPTEEDFLQPGKEQVAAGYAIYGPTTQLVVSFGKGVHEFTLDREFGAWFLSREKMQIPLETNEFSINAAYERYWYSPVADYIRELRAGREGPRRRDYTQRWVGSMVADMHRILTRGGIFLYPVDRKSKGQGGKLRLLYEANPMAFLVEQAGGLAIDGVERLLEIVPQTLHQRVGVAMGSKVEVERLRSFYKRRSESAPFPS
ncbi:MAG: class 1 fructose-bisphosphatase [Hydrogenophilus sp.]|nr:class 1 fructose-bisphosphatase [Hydrogenophilus sp.]